MYAYFLSSVYNACRCGVALDVWMLPLGEEIFNYDIDQPLLFVNTQAFHRWKENMDPLKKLIAKKPGKVYESQCLI